MNRCLIALAAVAVITTGSATAVTFRVGADAACTHSTIQGALQTSHNNGTGEDNIYVARNLSYTNQRLLVVNQSVNIYGGYATCADAADNTRTVIEGNASHSVFEVVGDTGFRETVRFIKLEITGGGADVDHGGGIQVAGLNRVFLDNTWIHDNVSDRGAGVFFDGSQGGQLIAIQGTLIGAGNEAALTGGGIHCEDAPAGINTGLFVDDSSVGFNRAPSGGGIYLDNCFMQLISRDDTGIIFNAAGLSGGGIYATNGSSLLVTGGYLASVSPVDARVLITLNVATSNGGGVYLDGGSTATFRDTEISLNLATNGSGGGVYAIGGAAVRFERGLNSICPISCARLSENRAPSGTGGGVAGINSDVSLTKTRVIGNEASRASAVYTSNGELIMDGVVVAANEGADVIVEAESTTSEIRYASFADNLNQVVDVSVAGGSLSLLSSIFDEQQGSVVSTSGGLAPTFGCLMVHELASLPAMGTIVTADPGFLDPASGNYHLSDQSPAIDFCSNLAGGGTDIDNQFRGVDSLQHADLFGTFDLGADEFDDFIFFDSFEN